MNDHATTVNASAAGSQAAPARTGVQVQHGEHIDTIETVDLVFKEQRRLSFTYGGVFFAVTLAIPALSVLSPGWYSAQIWGGFTLNYLFVSLIYYLFLWSMAWTYSKQADKLDEKLMQMADEIESKVKGGAA